MLVASIRHTAVLGFAQAAKCTCRRGLIERAPKKHCALMYEGPRGNHLWTGTRTCIPTELPTYLDLCGRDQVTPPYCGSVVGSCSKPPPSELDRRAHVASEVMCRGPGEARQSCPGPPEATAQWPGTPAASPGRGRTGFAGTSYSSTWRRRLRRSEAALVQEQHRPDLCQCCSTVCPTHHLHHPESLPAAALRPVRPRPLQRRGCKWARTSLQSRASKGSETATLN
mmetsp:Transcript_60869/g.199315  ORF Transcript_60869/g.199315 Transcript_60869/m.199315 type:complete len:226 (-) Transcript_60869:14-691(-)